MTTRHRQLHGLILRDLGYELPVNAKVLDFGCGSGEMVSEYRRAGFEAFGCDVKLSDENSFLRLIGGGEYRLPFEDSFFDFIFSDQVLEHVQDHRAAFSEMRRVLKPGGMSLHIFPAKLKPTEAHLRVPFGGALQSYAWLRLWSALGVRNSFQKGKSAKEVAELNYSYLRNRTHYLSKKEIIDVAESFFSDLRFAEKQMIKHSYGKARYIFPATRVFPFIASVYSSFYSRVIFFRREV